MRSDIKIRGGPTHAQRGCHARPGLNGLPALPLVITRPRNAPQGSIPVEMLFHLQANERACLTHKPWENCLFALMAEE